MQGIIFLKNQIANLHQYSTMQWSSFYKISTDSEHLINDAGRKWILKKKGQEKFDLR